MSNKPDLVSELYDILQSIEEHDAALQKAKEDKQDKILEIIAELNSTDKKIEFNVPEHDCTLVLTRYDYKEFKPEVKFELNKVDTEYKNAIAPLKKDKARKEKAIKLAAEKAGNFKPAPQWRTKIK